MDVNLCIFAWSWSKITYARHEAQGFSVLAFRDGDFRRFYLQARSWERDFDLARVKVEESTPIPIPIPIATDLPIRYCPQCGADLMDLIAVQRQAFDAFADSVRHLFLMK